MRDAPGSKSAFDSDVPDHSNGREAFATIFDDDYPTFTTAHVCQPDMGCDTTALRLLALPTPPKIEALMDRSSDSGSPCHSVEGFLPQVGYQRQPLSESTEQVVSDDGALPPRSQQIVLFRTDDRAVIFNRQTGCVTSHDNLQEALALPANASCVPVLMESRMLEMEHGWCPLCGSRVPILSAETRCYFNLLQDMWSTYMRRQGTRKQSAATNASSVAAAEASITQLVHRDIPASGSAVDSSCDSAPEIVTARGGVVANPEDAQLYDLNPHVLANGYYKQFFKEMQLLGVGSFGTVHLCVHVLDEQVLGHYAVKKIPVGDSKMWLREMLREVKIRENLTHPNIVDYKHSWVEMYRQNEMCPAVPWLFVLMTYCNCGDLEDLVDLNGQCKAPVEFIPEPVVWRLIGDICRGLQHLHRSCIIHRDLKCSNIFLNVTTEQGNHEICHALLSDFGTATTMFQQAQGAPPRKGFTGTMEYTAPELLMKDSEGQFSGSYSVRTDMWALGVVIYALAYNKLPFEVESNPEWFRHRIISAVSQTHQGHQGSFDNKAGIRRHWLQLSSSVERSPELQMLILSLLDIDSAKRPLTKEILHHPHLKEIFKEAERPYVNAQLIDIARQRMQQIHKRDDPAHRKTEFLRQRKERRETL